MGNPSISAVIMAHPRRRKHAESLRHSHPELNSELVLDPDPTGPRTALRTARLAWAAVAPGATHHLILQDDVLLSRDFATHLHAAVAARPLDSISFFAMWGSRSSYSVRLATMLGLSFVENASRYLPTQAVVVPAEVALGIAEFLQKEVTFEGEQDDYAIRRFLQRSGVSSVITVPNLAEHRDDESILGIIGKRQSTCFDADARYIGDFRLEPLSPHFVPYIQWNTFRALYDERQETGWTTAATPHRLTTLGLRHEDQVGILTDHMRETRSGRDALRDVGFALPFEVWVTSVALGAALAMTAGRVGVPVDVETALERPVAAQALATVCPGSLGRVLHSDELATYADWFTDLVHHGVRLGFTRLGRAE
jgi:hypothetical protein